MRNTKAEKAFMAACDRVNMSLPTFNVMLSYVEKYGAERVTGWIEISEERLPANTSCGARGRYISGIRRRWIEEEQERAQLMIDGDGI